jgi:DNA-binding LytR/AlgR family response regulator
MLDPEDFFRANRQFIIHIDSIAEIHPYFKGRVKLNLEPTQKGDLIISAEKSRSFKDWLDE